MTIAVETVQAALESLRRNSGATPNEIMMPEPDFRALCRGAGMTDDEIEEHLKVLGVDDCGWMLIDLREDA